MQTVEALSVHLVFFIFNFSFFEQGIWSLIELLDLHPLETDPIIQLVLDHLGEELRVKGEDSGDMEVSTSGSRLKVQDTDPGHLLLPQRNVDKNILWLKMKCIQENIK